MLVAMVGIEEHHDALVAEVTFTEPALVKAVNLRVSKNVTHSLQINDHQVTLSQLPRVVAQSLSNERLVGILPSCIEPTGIVVVLLIPTLDEVLSVVVLVRSIVIKDLIEERVNKLYEVPAVDKGDQALVELIHDMLANEHGLNIVLHLLKVVRLRVDVLWYLHDVFLLEVLVLHHECIAHSSFREGIIGNEHFRGNLALLQEWLLPVNADALVIHDEPGVASRVELLGCREGQIYRLDCKNNLLWLLLLTFLDFLDL
jgi:hypothetical protein